MRYTVKLQGERMKDIVTQQTTQTTVDVHNELRTEKKRKRTLK